MPDEWGAQAVLVHLPGALTNLFPNCERQVALHASTVAELIDALNRRWPGMRDRLCDARPAIRRHIHVFVEGERASLATPLAPGADVTILTAISGG